MPLDSGMASSCYEPIQSRSPRSGRQNNWASQFPPWRRIELVNEVEGLKRSSLYQAGRPVVEIGSQLTLPLFREFGRKDILLVSAGNSSTKALERIHSEAVAIDRHGRRTLATGGRTQPRLIRPTTQWLRRPTLADHRASVAREREHQHRTRHQPGGSLSASVAATNRSLTARWA